LFSTGSRAQPVLNPSPTKAASVPALSKYTILKSHSLLSVVNTYARVHNVQLPQAPRVEDLPAQMLPFYDLFPSSFKMNSLHV
jgi:hypothetical protein